MVEVNRGNKLADTDVDPAAERLLAGTATIDDLLDGRVLFGSPADVVEQLQAWQSEVGVTNLTAVLSPFERLDSRAHLHEQIQLLGTQVKPYLS
jgi:alkanesulfonate monooxygenase SsuD/methylene tetrahydromethanopterin reductase-like flavin-dependent oxidoreductase (luciferase family)